MRTLFHLVEKSNKSGCFPDLVEQAHIKGDECVGLGHIHQVSAPYLCPNDPGCVRKLLYRESPKNALKPFLDSPLLVLLSFGCIFEASNGIGMLSILVNIVKFLNPLIFLVVNDVIHGHPFKNLANENKISAIYLEEQHYLITVVHPILASIEHYLLEVLTHSYKYQSKYLHYDA